jgi:hypothetical protein
MASISNERLRALAHEAMAHLEYVDHHATVRGDLDSYKELCDHIESLERFLFKLIGC